MILIKVVALCIVALYTQKPRRGTPASPHNWAVLTVILHYYSPTPCSTLSLGYHECVFVDLFAFV